MCLRTPERLALLNTFHCVTYLHLSNLDLVNYNDYYRLLAGFVALQSPTNDDEIAAIFDCLARQRTVPALQHLYVKDSTHASSEKLATLLPRVAESLTNLELAFRFWELPHYGVSYSV